MRRNESSRNGGDAFHPRTNNSNDIENVCGRASTELAGVGMIPRQSQLEKRYPSYVES
jgi:hypothetical protein